MDDPKKKIDDKQIKAKEKSPGKLVESQLQFQNRNIKIELVKKTTTTMTSSKHRIEHEMSKTRQQQFEFFNQNHHNEFKTTSNVVADKRGELVKRLSQKIEPDRKEKSPDKRVEHLVKRLDKDKATSERKTEPIVEKRNMIETPENGFSLVKAATAAKEEEIIPVVESLSIPSITKTVEDQQPLQLTPPMTPLLIISEPTPTPPPPPPAPPTKCEAEPMERKLSQLITVNDEDDAFKDAIIRDNIIIDESMPTTNNETQNKDVIIVEEPIKKSPKEESPQDAPKDVPKETTTPISTDTMPIIQVIEVNSATTLTTTTTTTSTTSTTSVISQNEQQPISEAKEESSKTGTLDNIEKRENENENENEQEKEKNELEKNSTIECMIETAETEVNKTTTPLSDNNTNNTMNNDNDTNNTNNPTAQQTPESLDVATTTATVVEINEAETKVGNSNEDIITPNTLAEVVQSQENICSTTSSSASSSSSSSSSASQSSNATTSKQIIEQDEDVAANNNIITSSTINNEETTTPTIGTNSTQVSQEEAHMTSSTIASTITNHVKDEEQDSSLASLTAAAASYQSDDATLLESPGRARTKLELAAGYGFNEDQIGVFEETFQIFDKDCDGFITLVEIRTVMNALGFFPCDEIIRKSIQNIDSDNSGTVDFEEFICMMSKFRKVKTSSELDDELLDIFKIFDRNHDGFIDKDELKDVLMRLGEKITDEEVADMIKEADLDGDNKVSFSEFRSILHDNRTLSKT